MDSYPEPISQTELAKKSGVTKSAVSKIRTRLLEFCNQRIALFNRKLLLKSDFDSFSKLFMLFATDLRFKDFLQSKYAKFLIDKANIHGKLVDSFQEFSYQEYFSKEDTDMIINIILHNIYSIKIPEEFKGYIKKLPKDKESFNLMLPFAYIFNEFISKFNISIFESDVELMKLIKLRDKFYSFVLDNADSILRKWNYVKEKNPQEQEMFVKVYKETIKHLLHKYIADFTEKIQHRAKEVGIDFLEAYGKIGDFFKKEIREDLVVSVRNA